MPSKDDSLERVIATNLITEITVRIPALPLPCTYVRVVGPDGLELIYWDHLEWQEGEGTDCMEAIMITIEKVGTGHPFTLEHQIALDEERQNGEAEETKARTQRG